MFGVFTTTLRPTSSMRNGFVEYDTSCALSASAVADSVLFIHSSVLPSVVSQDNDQEARECGIAVLGSLVAHFGDILLADAARSSQVFELLLKRIDNEVTRMSSMRALIKISSSAHSYEMAASNETVGLKVFPAVTKLLGQQDRSLRQTALR